MKYAAWDVIPWDIKTVEAFAASGTSLMLDALGDPWIAYYDFSNGDLKLAHWGLRGDTDHDRDVDFGDYQALERNFGITTGATWEMGDFDYDGEVGFADYQALERNFGRFIPEPGAVWIVAFVVLPLLRARHR